MTSRLTGDDLIALSARIAADLDSITGRVPSIAEDFNRLMSGAPEAIGRQPWDFNAAELDDLACMVLDAIAGRSPVVARLEYLRGEIRAERISYGELAELQGLAAHIAPHDVELLEWAGVPEEEYRANLDRLDGAGQCANCGRTLAPGEVANCGICRGERFPGSYLLDGAR